jgi:hypothetical protein
MNLANESYFMIENEIKRINMVIERLKFERDNLDSNYFSYNNYLIDKNYNDIVNFENNVNSKRRAKGKKLINDAELYLNSKNKKNKKKIRGKDKNLLLKNKRKRIDSKIEDTNNVIDEEQIIKLIENNEDGWEDVTYKELDGKIGPKEPVYCFCNYISYGNMIKCDNPTCKREWFHFHCVGLKNQPKGKWFCSEKCAKEYMKKFNSHNIKKTKTKIKAKPKSK